MPWGRRARRNEREKTEEKSSSSHEAAVWFAQESKGWWKVGAHARERDYRIKEWGRGAGMKHQEEMKRKKQKEWESFKLRQVVGLIEVKESLKMAKLQKQKKPQ